MRWGLCILAMLVACDETPPRNEFQGHYTGEITLVASGAPIGAAGYAVTVPFTIDVTDFGYDESKEIIFVIGKSCTLRGHWTARGADSSRGSEIAFLYGDAFLYINETCTIEEATFRVGFGTAHVDASHDLSIDIAGPLTDLKGALPSGATANVAYHGR